MKVWYSSDVNTLSLNGKGIVHNGLLLEWENIVSTYIYTIIDKRNKGEKNSFLIIEFKDGRIRLFDITGISTKNFFERLFLKTSDEEIIGHYIEKYKLNKANLSI